MLRRGSHPHIGEAAHPHPPTAAGRPPRDSPRSRPFSGAQPDRTDPTAGKRRAPPTQTHQVKSRRIARPDRPRTASGAPPLPPGRASQRHRSESALDARERSTAELGAPSASQVPECCKHTSSRSAGRDRAADIGQRQSRPWLRARAKTHAPGLARAAAMVRAIARSRRRTPQAAAVPSARMAAPPWPSPAAALARRRLPAWRRS